MEGYLKTCRALFQAQVEVLGFCLLVKLTDVCSVFDHLKCLGRPDFLLEVLPGPKYSPSGDWTLRASFGEQVI